MTQEELQNKIDHLIDVEKNKYFSLQDKNLNVTVAKSENCVFFPKDGRLFKNNANEIRNELVQYVFNTPKKYILHYSRTTILKNALRLTIDTRENDIQTTNIDTLKEMDERNKEERRSDELYIREILSKNGFLESEVQRLKDKIEELEGMLEDAETEAEENKHANMADATTSTIGQIAPVIMQMAEKYFSLQQQKNDMLAEQIRRQAPMRPQPTNQTQEQPANGFYYEQEN